MLKNDEILCNKHYYLQEWGTIMSGQRVKKKIIFSSYPFKIKTINLQIAFVIINYYSLLHNITSSSQEKKLPKTHMEELILSNP